MAWTSTITLDSDKVALKIGVATATYTDDVTGKVFVYSERMSGATNVLADGFVTRAKAALAANQAKVASEESMATTLTTKLNT